MQQESQKIEVMIQAEIVVFKHWFKALGVSPVIRALQDKSAQIHEEIIGSLFNKLPNLNEREQKLIWKLTKSIANQLIHDPILRVRSLMGSNGENAIEMFSMLFALEEFIAPKDQLQRTQSIQQMPALELIN